KRRDGYSLRRSVYLWLTYARCSLEYTAGHPRCLVFYEDFMEDWGRELQRLGRFLGGAGRGGRPGAPDAGRGLSDPAPRHPRTPAGVSWPGLPDGDNLDRASRALAAAQGLYVRLRQEPAGPADMGRELQAALEMIGHGAWDDAYEEWQVRRRRAAAEIPALVPAGSTFILIDEDRLACPADASRRCVPFLER